METETVSSDLLSLFGWHPPQQLSLDSIPIEKRHRLICGQRGPDAPNTLDTKYAFSGLVRYLLNGDVMAFGITRGLPLTVKVAHGVIGEALDVICWVAPTGGTEHPYTYWHSIQHYLIHSMRAMNVIASHTEGELSAEAHWLEKTAALLSRALQQAGSYILSGRGLEGEIASIVEYCYGTHKRLGELVEHTTQEKQDNEHNN